MPQKLQGSKAKGLLCLLKALPMIPHEHLRHFTPIISFSSHNKLVGATVISHFIQIKTFFCNIGDLTQSVVHSRQALYHEAIFLASKLQF